MLDTRDPRLINPTNICQVRPKDYDFIQNKATASFT